MCEHLNFKAQVDVFRMSEVDNGPITHYSATVKIQCAECDQEFEFIGVPAGINRKHPTSDVSFRELNAPIRPFTNSIASTASYQVRPDPPSKTND